MELTPKVVAAIGAAINAYIADEEALLAMQAQRAAEVYPRQAFSQWVMAGRSASMEIRRTWQMRLVR
ncbi:MAG: hypothetical protein ABFD98_07725 [Syntrophobacteraceae bacterium]|nr:hypothetical protein [Desulfobacteraceae bacterium]